jgi:hypothetical protein
MKYIIEIEATRWYPPNHPEHITIEGIKHAYYDGQSFTIGVSDDKVNTGICTETIPPIQVGPGWYCFRDPNGDLHAVDPETWKRSGARIIENKHD